jgi:hypothetical protein
VDEGVVVIDEKDHTNRSDRSTLSVDQAWEVVKFRLDCSVAPPM